MKVNVLPADTYLVINKTILNDQDRKLLTTLYQPIIGNVAISLYFTLWSYLDKNDMISTEWTHHHLMTSMRLKLEDIVIAREKLEAIGLLKTYYMSNHVNHFVYAIYSPLSVSEFLKNPILSTTLFNNIGKVEYQNVINYFKVPTVSLKDYTEITRNFDQVFQVEPLSSLDSLLNSIKERNVNKLEFKPTIEIDNVLALIPEEILNKSSITNQLKDLIIKTAYIYKLNEDDIVDIIRNSINAKKMIDRELLKENAINYYQFENSGKLPSVVYRTQPEYLKEPVGDSSPRAKAIYTFERISPYDLLKSKSDNQLTKKEREILSMLAVDFDLKPGVINVLIDYVLKINNNKLTKNFIEAIASQWKRSKIETVSQAMDIANREYKSKKKVTPKVMKEKQVPEWFNSNIEKTEASSKEQEELNKLLESL